MPEPIGFIAPRRRGGLVAGLRSGFHLIDLPEGRVTPIGNPEPDRPGNRFNDGKVDPMGRLWAGTVEFGCTEPTGAFYRLDPDHRWHRMDDGYIVTNGPAFSPDGSILYEADSERRVVYAYDLDLAGGAISNRRPFVIFAEDDGVPDGMTVDRDGHLWVAHWGGSRVSRFRPDGTLDRADRDPGAACHQLRLRRPRPDHALRHHRPDRDVGGGAAPAPAGRRAVRDRGRRPRPAGQPLRRLEVPVVHPVPGDDGGDVEPVQGVQQGAGSAPAAAAGRQRRRWRRTPPSPGPLPSQPDAAALAADVDQVRPGAGSCRCGR